MKKLFLVFAMISMLMVSCKKEERVPKGIYTKQEMAEIMIDIYLLEAKVRELGTPPDSTRLIYDYYEKKIFSDHQADDSLYKISFEYYLNHPDALSEIYAVMVDSLSLKERLETKQPTE